MTGAQRIAAERKRQIDSEGWSREHDDEHSAGELARAAACYALNEIYREEVVEECWPWDPEWWKPTGGRIRCLEKAGALIAAEIDRLLRARGAKEGR